jgi:L-asparagine transporter-like permease
MEKYSCTGIPVGLVNLLGVRVFGELEFWYVLAALDR